MKGITPFNWDPVTYISVKKHLTPHHFQISYNKENGHLELGMLEDSINEKASFIKLLEVFETDSYTYIVVHYPNRDSLLLVARISNQETSKEAEYALEKSNNTCTLESLQGYTYFPDSTRTFSTLINRYLDLVNTTKVDPNISDTINRYKERLFST